MTKSYKLVYKDQNPSENDTQHKRLGLSTGHGYHAIKELIKPFISYFCLEGYFSLPKHEPVYLRTLGHEYIPETGSVKFSRAGSHRWMAVLELAYHSEDKRPLGGTWPHILENSQIHIHSPGDVLRDRKEKASELT